MQFYPRLEVMFFLVISVLFTFIIHEEGPWKMIASNGKDKNFPFILLDTAARFGVSVKCLCCSVLSYLHFS